MTDTMPTMPTDTEPAIEDQPQPDPATEPAADDSPDQERKLRKRAQAAEAERDQLRARVDALTKRQVEQLVGSRLHNASDLWISTSVADLLDESGDVDPAKVEAAITELRAARPYLGPNAAAPASQVTFGAEKPDLEGAQPPSWQQVLQGAQRKV